MTEPALVASGLTRRFGGLVANDNVSITLEHGRVHALLGPNGAGKSTLINLLSGDLAPSAGSIRLGTREIAGLGAAQRSRLGLGRSYQKTNIFGSFTVHENCRLAAQARRQRPWRIFADAIADRATNDIADAALETTGLRSQHARLAATLSHGEQRQLEIAMVLATGARVLLLDEPLAGMGAQESARMVELLRRLAPDHAILLVEHDMDAVFAVADEITVMVEGRVLETGTPANIRASAAVREAYLGTEAVLA